MSLRLAVVGCGVFGLEHLDSLTHMDLVDVVAVCDSDITVANRASELFRVPRIFTDLKDLLEAGCTDAVVIAAPSHLHASMAEACLQAGAHVLVEKPLATTTAEAEGLARVAHAHSELIALPGHILRHSRTHRRIQRAVRMGEIGRVQTFEASRDRELGHHDRYSDTTPTFLTMVHDIDMALWTTGQEPEIVTALATLQDNRVQPSVVSALVHTKEGSTWSLRCSWALPRAADNEDRLRVIGTAGTIWWENSPGFVLKRGVDAVGPLLSTDRLFASEIDDENQHFVECILEGRQSDRVSIDEAVIGIRVAEAVDRSWQRSGEPQHVG